MDSERGMLIRIDAIKKLEASGKVLKEEMNKVNYQTQKGHDNE